MNEFCDMREIVERIKDIISLRLGNKNVFDIDVAIELKINKKSMSTIIKRNTIPHKEIMLFCSRYSINPLKILTIRGF